MKSHVMKCVVFLLLFFALFSAVAQPVAPPKDPDPPGTLVHPPDEPVNGAPVDGGLTILLTLGGIYAARQIFRRKKED